MKKIIRVFTSETRATPKDELSFIGVPPPFYAEAEEVHISVLFTWHLQFAEYLAEQWKHVAPVKIGGPALNQPSDNFVSGMYVKKGYTITSRGCPNKCWFCSVWKREPVVKELPIVEGYNILDDNILACSENHIKSVFEMLKKQNEKPQFTGGLEAKILKEWHVQELSKLKPRQMFFAYDTPDDLEPLVNASKMLTQAGFNRQSMRCYVLIGYNGDTLEQAEKRLIETTKLNFFPMAMLWKNNKGEEKPEWKKLQRNWSKPAIIYSMLKQHLNDDLDCEKK